MSPLAAPRLGLFLSNTGSILCAKGVLNVARGENAVAQNTGFVLIVFPLAPEQEGQAAFLLAL